VFQGRPTVLAVTGGHFWSYTPRVSDPDGERNLTFWLVSGPTGMNVDSSSGTVSWRPGASASGVYPVSINVSDGISSTTQEFSISVMSGAEAGPVALWPIGAMAVIVAVGAAAGVLFLRKRRARSVPEEEGVEPEKADEPAAASETYEKEEAGKGQAVTADGLAALPPPETVAATAAAEPMKPVAKAPESSEAQPEDTEMAITAPAHARPEAPSAPAPSPSLSAGPAPNDMVPSLPSPPLSPGVTSFIPAAPAQAPEPISSAPAEPALPKHRPAPPSGGNVSLKDDMDFLRSYLSDKPSSGPDKPVVANVEWQQIKEYAIGLKPPAAPATGKETSVAVQDSKQVTGPSVKEPAPELKPAAQTSKEQKPVEKAAPSLDDILKELDG
jgi:hypothetical protein